MTRNKKIIIIVVVLIIGWICFRTAVVSYSLYQDDWRLGNIGWKDIGWFVSGITKSAISEIIYPQKESPSEEIINERITPEQILEEYNQTRTAEQREEVVENIKDLFGKDLEVAFVKAKPARGYAEWKSAGNYSLSPSIKVLETYEDNEGFEYEVIPETNEITMRNLKDFRDHEEFIPYWGQGDWEERIEKEKSSKMSFEEAEKIAKDFVAKLVGGEKRLEEEYDYLQKDRLSKAMWAYSFEWRRPKGKQFTDKGEFVERTEFRIVEVSIINGEILHYAYKPATSPEELAAREENFEGVKQRDIGAIREFLGNPNMELIFVNFLACSECGEGGTPKTFRVYKDENGYCYDIDEDRNIFPDTETLRTCKTPQL